MVHVAIVGAYGSAGVSVARELADEPGVELTLIDDGDPGGGLCILRGCMPSKEVLSAGAHSYRARIDHRVTGETAVDLDAVVETKDEHVLGFAEHRREGVHDVAARENVAFYHGTAHFLDRRRLEVEPSGREIDVAVPATGPVVVEPDYVVVATGSTVNLPTDLPGFGEVDHWTSADVLDATEFPDSGVVMGFGYVGLELVPYLAEAGGMDLTVIEHDARPLDEADPEYGDELLRLYREEYGVEVLPHTYEQRVEPTGDGGVRLRVRREAPTAGGGEAQEDGGGAPPEDGGATPDVEDGTAPAAGATDAAADEAAIEADALFCFTGRRPAIDGLGLANAGIEPGPGWVAETMQAVDAPTVFVVGDANGKEPILHVAKEQGMRAASNVLAHAAGESMAPYENVAHHVVFSALGVYPYARLGHTAGSAEAAGIDHVAVHRQASDDGVFASKDVPEGMATLVVGADGTVLGYQGLHYHADVMAKTMQIAIELGLDVRELPARAYHPTTPEILDGLFRDAVAAIGS